MVVVKQCYSILHENISEVSRIYFGTVCYLSRITFAL
uniref:Uncharacterized protein n=1 Tax=Caudovirales sp. ctMVT27 TaxID=2826771 RepID=A0A8S5M2C3_9CAUD|nr:MAG TPA: hypothetical protein [Caudovirales sp. ctMVT27]